MGALSAAGLRAVRAHGRRLGCLLSLAEASGERWPLKARGGEKLLIVELTHRAS